jgi:hypothetical protein
MTIAAKNEAVNSMKNKIGARMTLTKARMKEVTGRFMSVVSDAFHDSHDSA